MRKGILLLGALLGALYVGAADIKSAAYLWLDASKPETLVTNDQGQVTEWKSALGEGGLSATTYTLQSQSPTGPTLIDAGRPGGAPYLVSFGSTSANRDLHFTKSANIRAVFMVAKVEQSPNAFLLGDDEKFQFHRGTSSQYWDSTHGYAGKNGTTYFNGIKVEKPFDTVMPNRLALVDLQASVDLTASQLCYDRLGNGNTPRRGGKDIAEVLVFTNVLTVAQQQEVRDYLMTKWGVWEQGDAKVVRAHPRLTIGLERESLIGIKLTEGQSGALTNLTVRFDLTNCTPEQVRDVRVWRQKYDPVPFTFFERDAIDLTEKGLSGKRGAEVVAPYHGALTVDFVATNVTGDLTIYPKSGSMAEGDYIWITAKIDESIATNAEIWASITGDRVRLTSGDFKLSNQVAKAPHRPFPYKYQIGAYVRQDRLVDNGQTTWDIFSGNPKERFETLTDVLPIYSAKDGYSNGKFYISNWDKNLNDTASTARLVKLRDQYNPGCMIRPSLTPSTWVSANGIYGLAFEVAGAAEATRKQFAEEIVAFLVKQNCDGLDIDYEWVRDGTNHREWQNIGKMLRELSEQFFDHGFVLSFAGRSHDSAQSGMPYSAEDYGAFNVSDYMMMQSYGGGWLNSAPCIQRRALDVCTKRLLPLRRVVMGQAAYVSADGHPGWDGASYKIEAFTSDPLRRFDIDTWWKVPYSAYWPFEGMSSLQAQCLWARREELGGVMSWGYYTDPTWEGWSSFGRHQSKAIWPMPNCWQEPAVEVEKVGGGGEEKWYVLRTEEDWFWLAKHPDVKAKLANDITLEHDPPVIDTWTGELDGDNHTLTIATDTWIASEKATGLIRTLSGTVKNLTVQLNGRVFTVAARWNDQTANPADTRLVNTMQGENPVGVIAAEATDGAIVENVTVTMGAGSEVKGVKYAGGLVGKVSGSAIITNNTIEVGGKLHLEVRNIWDTLFQPSSPAIDGAVGFVAEGAGATIADNTVTVLPGGEIQDLDYIPEPQYEIAGDWCDPTGFDWALPWDLDVRSSDYAVEVVMELPNYTEGMIPAGHYPQLVNLTGADKSVSLSASGDGGGELFLTGSSSTASYAHPISRGAIRGNGDVGSGIKLAPTNHVVTLVIENRGGELRIIQNGETVLVTDKNVASDGYVRSVQIGSGLSQLGGGRIVSVRLKLGRKSPLVHPEGYGKLVFDEEFDGDTIDWEHNWEKVPIMWSGAPDWRKYTSHREDLTVVSNGCLVLTGAKNDGSVPGDTRKYQCGQIQSNKKFSFKYGVVEIRAKFTDQDGAWPAIWMMPQYSIHGGWPESGEIDISERLNADDFTYQTAHFGPQGTDRTSGSTGAINRHNFNIFRLEWDENKITWSINGVVTHSYSNDGTGHLAWPFDSEFYFILSQQLEGGWVGTVDDETTLPNRMFIDYVRVWQKDEDNIQTNAYLWLDAKNADSIVTNASGEVTSWTSDNIFGRAATKYTLPEYSPSGPTLIDSGRPVVAPYLVSFGDMAANRDLCFGRATDLRTVFLVAKTEQSGNAFLLGDSSKYDLHRGSTGAYWDGVNAAESVREGHTFWNGELVTNATSALMPSELGLVELHAADAFTASQLCYDRVGNGSTNPRRGGKDIAELVVFKDALTYTQRLKLRKALTEKWNLAHPNWTITEDWVLRRENDFSGGIGVDAAFADGAGTYEFKNIKLTGGLQSSSYKLRVREDDAIVIDGTDNGNGRCRFAFEMLGGNVTFPKGPTTWYENPTFIQKGGTFMSLANGQEQVDTSSGFMLGYNGVTMTLDISGGLFTVPNSSLNFFNPVTLNIGRPGTSAPTAVVHAKGLFRSSLNPATVNVNKGGRLEIGSLGIKANTCALNLKGGTLAAFEDGAAVHDNINLLGDATVEVPTNTILAIDGTLYGTGKLSLAGEGSLKLTVAVTPEELQSGTVKPVMHVAEDFPLARCELYFDCPEYFSKPKKADSYAIVDGVLYLKPSMPDLRADAYLWLDASLPETLSTNAQGEVIEWRSALSEGGLSATIYTLSTQTPTGPLVGADTLGRPLVSFGNTDANRDLCFQKSENIRTVFMVAKIQQNANAFVLGDRDAFHFHRGGSGEYWHTGHSSDYIRNGKTYWNGTLVNNPTGTTIPNALGLTTIETTGGITASQLCYDRTGNGSTPRRGGKDIAELLIFEKTLTADERRSIENYLIAKWHLGDCQTIMVEGSPAVFSPATSNVNLYAYGDAPTSNGTFTVVNAMVGAADVTLTEVPDVAKLDLILTMKTSLSIPGGGRAAFTIPSGSSVTIGAGGYLGAITATDATSALRFTGEKPIDWPFAAKDTVFPGLLTLACPIANSGRQYLYGDKSVVFDTGSSMTTDALNLGNEGNVTQNLTIRGGDITVTGAIEPLATTGSVIFAHWPSRVNFTLKDGAFTALNAATMLGWDGHANLTISGGKMSVKGLLANRASSNDNTSSVILSGGELSLGSSGIDFTGRGDRNASFTLAGGTLSCREDAAVAIAQEDGLYVYTSSTLAAASNATLTVIAPLKGAGDLSLDAPCGTIAFADISDWTGSFVAVTKNTHLRITVARSAEEIAARKPVTVAQLPKNVTAEQCTVKFYNTDTGGEVASTVTLEGGKLVATPEMTDRHLTYTPTEEVGTFVWDDTEGAFDGETFQDFDSVAFQRVVSEAGTDYVTSVTLPESTWASRVDVGGTVSFSGETLYANAIVVSNAHFAAESLVARSIAFGPESTIRLDGTWRAVEELDVPFDATMKAVEDGVLALTGPTNRFENGVTFDFSDYAIHTSGRHYIVTGEASAWPTSTAFHVVGGLPLYKDDAGYFTETIVTVTVTNGEELVIGEDVYDNLNVQSDGTLVYRGTMMTVTDSVTFDADATVTLFEKDGSKIPYALGDPHDIVKAKSITGIPKSTQDFTFKIVDNGDGTQTLRATRNLGSARVIRAHPLLTRGVGQESLIGIDFSGNYGGAVPSVTFKFRFVDMTADDLGNITLWKMPYGTPYAFYEPDADNLTSYYALEKNISADGHEMTLTYTLSVTSPGTTHPTWIFPEVDNREYSDRLWLTGELQNLKTLSDSAHFSVDVTTDYVSLTGGSGYKVENGIAAAPHRLYPWRYLVTAYMRRDRINGNTIGTLQNSPEMRWPSLTHVIVSSFDVQYNWGADAMQIYWDDNATGAFKRLKQYRDAYHPECRLVPSLTKGGYVSLDSRGTGTAENRYAIAHAGEKKYRAQFVKYLVAKMQEMGADGLDIDWEYPDENGLDYNAYGLLMRDLAEAFFDHGWDLSMCSNLGYRMPNGEVMAAADYMSSMAYGANRGLHAMNTTMSTAIDVLTSRNVPRRRIVVGQAIYSTAKWHMGWDELAGRCGNDDDIINESWSYNGASGEFIGFTGPTTYRAKANRVKGVYSDGCEYGGIMSWGYYTDTGWWGGKSLGWNQRQTIWPRPYNFPTPPQDADGTYVISNETDWCWFSENAVHVAKARLAADITFDHDPKPIPAFSGTFDGGGHKLTIGSGVWIVAFEKVGLFQTLTGTIKNLRLDVAGRFIGRNDRRNDVQSGWTLSAHGGDGVSAAVLVAEANAGAHIENVHVLMRKGSELRGNHEVGVLAGQVWTGKGGKAVVIRVCTVECFGTVSAKAVDSVNAVITSGATGNGRVGLLVGSLNFDGTSEGVTLQNCSATLRAGAELSSVSGNYRTLGGLVGNLHVGAGDTKFVWSGLSMTCYEGATVSGLKDNSGTPYHVQPFFGTTFGTSSWVKPPLGTANALTFYGAKSSGFDSSLWLTGAVTYMGATDSGEAPIALPGAVTNFVDNLGVMTVSALLDLPANGTGDAILAQCTGGYQIWANVSPTPDGNMLSITLGFTKNGTRTSCGELARLVPGTHELTLALSQTSGTTLYLDGNLLTTQAGYKFSSNPFIEARLGFKGVGLYAYDIIPGALCQVRYPKKATYETVNLITFDKDDDPLMIRDITCPTTLASATMKAAIWSPEDIPSGPIADWKVAKDSAKYVVEAYRESATSTRIKWRNESGTARSEAAQTVTAIGNTGTRTLNFIHRNDNNGTTVAFNAKTAADSPATKWSGSAITGAALGLRAGMSVANREWLLGAVDVPDPAHPLDGFAEEPEWYVTSPSDVQDYFRDTVVSKLGSYDPPPVTINGREVTGGESAQVIYLFGGDCETSDDYTLAMDAPEIAADGVSVSLAGTQPVNAWLQLFDNVGLTNGWSLVAELPPTLMGKTFTLERKGPSDFYSARALIRDITLSTTRAMPVCVSQDLQAYMGDLQPSASTVVVQLEGAGVTEGMTGYLTCGESVALARVDADGKLTFSFAADTDNDTAKLYLLLPVGSSNGNIRVVSPSVSGVNYPDVLVTEVVADNLYKDKFSPVSGFGNYRIPALVTDGKGEVLCCYDVRYGGGDLGTGDGIDIGETYSADFGNTFEKPRLAVDVVNKRNNDGSQRSGENKTWDIGDVALLYDPATSNYWMMGMTGTGLYQGNYSMNDVVMYTRGKGPNAAWTPWKNPQSNSTDPLEYRSIKETIINQPGIKSGTGSKGYGFLEGPGHGFVTTVGTTKIPKGTLVFPTQYFVDSSLTASSAGAIYSTDHGQTWIATHRSTIANGPQENCVMELDDGSWYMSCKAGYRSNNYAETGRFQFFRSTDFVEWTYVDEMYPVPCQQGSCLRLGKGSDGRGRYVFCHTIDRQAGVRAKLALVFGVDTTAEGSTAGISWDFSNPLMLYYENTGFKGYNSLCMVDDHTLGVLYEAQGHIYFIRIDVSDRLGRAAATIKM